MSKVVLITGCSSGIGLAAAVLLAKKGHNVYATLRDMGKKSELAAAAEKENAKLQLLQLDVTSDESVNKTAAEIMEKEGKIDVLINNAGYGLMGPAETVTMEQAKAEFEVNFFGLLRVTQAVLPHMRKQKSGRIINLSSIAGLKSMPTSDLYNASKYAVEGLTEAMAPPLALAGIKLSLIEPGPVSTNFNTSSIKWGTEKTEEWPYMETIAKMKKTREERFADAQKPEEVAELIGRVIEEEKPHLRYQTSEWVRKAAGEKMKDLEGGELVRKAMEQLR